MKLSYFLLSPETGRVRWPWRLCTFGALFLGALALLSIIFSPLIRTESANTDILDARIYVVRQIAYQFVSIAAVLLASKICMGVFDKRRLRTIGYQFDRNWLNDYLLGTGISFAMFTAVVLIAWASGFLVLGRHPSNGSQLIGGLALAFLFYNVAAVNEELLFRGFPLQTLLVDLPAVWAISIPSLIFGLLHLYNPSPTALSTLNTVLAGVWLSVAYWRTGNLWLCTGLHYGWNFLMGPVFGLSVSGLDPMTRTGLFTARAQGPPWIMGSKYGPEGGLLVTVVLLITIFLLASRRRPLLD